MKKSIREFDALYPTDCTSIEDYESLKRLMIDNLAENRPHVLTICSNSKNGDVGLQAMSYVGVIGFSNGNCLEIMPKIASVEEDKTLYSKERSKLIFLEMLTFSRYSHKELMKTGLGSASTDILEYFIQRYADDVRTIIKQGVVSSYYNIEHNDRFLRGTIDFPNHIRNNTVHQERFYIRTQLFGQNRPENRIIKSTLLFLYRKTNDSKNKRELNDLLCYFEEIPSSIDIQGDYEKIIIERNMQTYKDVLVWSILFLKNKSFDLYCGKTISYALVFPMELLYQDFIAKKIESLSQGRYAIEKQQKDTLLEQFEIIPDIVVNVGDRRYILDTKWKKLKPDGKPSESDLYQMYVYTTKMNSAETILIYPKCYPENSPKSYSEKVFDQKIIISTWFVDLNNIDDSLSELIEHFVEG